MHVTIPPDVNRSGVYAELVDFDRMYESVSDRAILINNFNLTDDIEKQRLYKLMATEYEGDTFDSTPTCSCGEIKGEFNRGIRCDLCGTQVLAPTEQKMESILWMRCPPGVKGFVSPIAWTVLQGLFRKEGVRLLRWLADPTYVVPQRKDLDSRLVQIFISRGWRRGINYFIEHFDEIIDLMLELRVVSPIRRALVVKQFVEDNRHKLFPQYLPIPNRAVFIAEKTPVGTLTDPIMYNAIDSVLDIASLEHGLETPSQQKKENRTIKAVVQLSTYYDEYIKSNLGKKPGMFRRQVFGGRLDFSGRAVITSISRPHWYKEIHLPWGLAMTMYKTHITSKLLRRGYTPSECEEMLMLHITKTHPVLREVMDELIAESPIDPEIQAAINRMLREHREVGPSLLNQRNPTLVRGSAQHFYVTKVKDNPFDNTIGMSVLTLSAPNQLGNDAQLVSVTTSVASKGNLSRRTPLIAGTSC